MMKQLYWLNEPQEWQQEAENSLSMFVTPKTDFWRRTHYGFIVDDGPFCYVDMGGEWEMSMKITGDYQSRYDQMGLMIRKDEETWIKAGIEYVDEKMNLSAVVTHRTSDWSMRELPQAPRSIWLKAVRRLDAITLLYSLDGMSYSMFRLAYFPAHTPVKVGMMAASPDGHGFHALFEEIEIKHLPDQRREEWLRENQD